MPLPAARSQKATRFLRTSPGSRSYVLEERDGSVGTVCIYRASSPEAIRAHAARADLPIDEIVAVSGTVVIRPDPEPATATA